jgi:hypothetical protein
MFHVLLKNSPGKSVELLSGESPALSEVVVRAAYDIQRKI